MSFSVGESISVIDAVDGLVRKCKVVEVDNVSLKVKIHYINWSSNLDEWLSFNSDRICIDDPESIPECSEKKEVIGGLLLSADEISKQVISLYSIDANNDDNEKNLNKASVANLEHCAKFLKITLKDSNDKKLYIKKSLVKQLILRIWSLMPSKCDECLPNPLHIGIPLEMNLFLLATYV